MDTTTQDAPQERQVNASAITVDSQSVNQASTEHSAEQSSETPKEQQQEASTESSKDPRSDNPHWKPRAPRMVGPDGQLLSRNATKKLIKQQEFLERRPMMKQQEKLKRKKKQLERREAIEKGNALCASI
jgi:hypothetical protein